MSKFGVGGHPVVGKKGKSLPGPKTCATCGSRGAVKDTRQHDELVTRRYGCVSCGHKWETYEVTLTKEELESED